MTAETTGLRTEQGSDQVRASDQQLSSGPRRDSAVQPGGRWYPPSEAIGGAIAGGLAGGYAFGPLGTLVGVFIGVAVAVSTTRYFATRTH